MKNVRETNTKQTSIIHTVEDLYNLLIISDPLILSLRKIHNKKPTSLCAEAKLLIFI